LRYTLLFLGGLGVAGSFVRCWLWKGPAEFLLRGTCLNFGLTLVVNAVFFLGTNDFVNYVYLISLPLIVVIGVPFYGRMLFKFRMVHSARFDAVYFLSALVLHIYYAIMSYAMLYKLLGIIDTSITEGPSVTHDPETCLYFSVVTWTTLGYGDFRPTPGARLAAASEAMVGYIAMAVLISAFARVLSGFMSSPVSEDDS
jgi:Ion channel